MSVPISIRIYNTGENLTYVKTIKGIHTYNQQRHPDQGIPDCVLTINDEQLDKLVRVNEQFNTKQFLFYNTNFEL